jgi:hypothetical protein
MLFLITVLVTLLVSCPLPVALALNHELFSEGNVYWHLATVVLAMALVIALGCVSLRDPGVAVVDDEMLASAARMTREEFYTRYRWCRRCRQPMANDTAHCNSCGCCIRGLDHHCSFIGKCVGHRTKLWFGLFVGLLPLAWVYNAVSAWHSGYTTLFTAHAAVLGVTGGGAALFGGLILCQCMTCSVWGPRCTCRQQWPMCMQVFGPCSICCDNWGSRRGFCIRVADAAEGCIKGRDGDKNIDEGLTQVH